MFAHIILWGALTGIIHFILIGALYGNPFIDRIYQDAQRNDDGVRKWESRKRYLITQFLGTQVEIYILTAGFVWLNTLTDMHTPYMVFLSGLLFAGIRVYPRFWNMWIQSTYPMKMLVIEAVNGTISTFVIVFSIFFLMQWW